MALFSDEHDLVREQARRFLTEHWCPKRHRTLLEEPGHCDDALWASTTAFGWPAAAMSEEFGGSGPDWGTMAVLSEELGRGVATGPFLASWVTGHVIERFGTAMQKSRWLEPLAAGKVKAAFAFAENDACFETPRARFAEGRLTGCKIAVPFAGQADFALVTAHGDHGAILVLVPLDDVTHVAKASIDNSRGTAVLHFEDSPGESIGADALWPALEMMWILGAFEQIGGARACLMAARDYALERRTFGQQIGRYQAIKHKLAEIYTAIEIAHGNALVALAAFATAGRAPLGAAAARYAATLAYDLAARESIQVHGGIGCTWESNCHIHYRRARALALETGSSHFARERIVDALFAEQA